MRRLLHVAMTRARKGLVLAWAEAGAGSAPRPSPFYEEARAALRREEESSRRSCSAPPRASTPRSACMRDEVLDSVARMGGRLGEMRLDTYLDVSQAVVALPGAAQAGRADRARPRRADARRRRCREVNELLLQGATPEQRELFEQSALDELRCATPSATSAERAEASRGRPREPSLEPFIPRRGRRR